MAPRSGARVKIVSPNSGTVTLSRSASVHSTRSHTNASTAASTVRGLNSACSSAHGSPVYPRQPLAEINNQLNSRVPSSNGGSKADVRAAYARSDSRSNVRGADQEAIQRAQEALEAVGRNVLKKPFSSHGANTVNTNEATENKTRPPLKAQAQNNSSSMQLPQSIVGLYRKRSRSHSTFAETSRGSSASSRRPRSTSAVQPADHGNPLRRVEQLQHLSTLLTTTATANKGNTNGNPGAAPQPPQPPQQPLRVCPAMFTGLSAIPLSARLFDSVDAPNAPANYYPAPGTASDPVQATSNPSSEDFCPRRCVRPLWSLVGTFKTALTSVVNVDYGNDCLNWQQRNPKGGFQRIRVPLHAVLDAVVARITQEDEDIKERQFTVIVRTSSRPSQVVFGFKSTREANEFRNMVRPAGI